jgi:NitT/TauT family transport system ATP-binding protein
MLEGSGAAKAGEVRSAGLGLRLRGVRRVFEGARGGAPMTAVEELDLDVAPREFLAILGPSGCGKSTLLRMIAGLDRPSAGELALLRDGEAVAPGSGRSGELAYVFQDAHLLPWRDVLANVMLPLELLGAPSAERRDAAREALAAVRLEEFGAHHPAQLSGGMRMRVSLARALVTRPRLLLLDEPFAALDEITRQALDEQLRALWAGSDLTVVFVTHSIGEAAFLAERAVVLSQRPARLLVDERVELPHERTAALRAEPAFARLTGRLRETLVRASGEAP